MQARIREVGQMERMPETLGPGMKEEVELKDKGVEEPDRGPEPSRSHQKGSETDRARQINEVERPGGGDS